MNKKSVHLILLSIFTINNSTLLGFGAHKKFARRGLLSIERRIAQLEALERCGKNFPTATAADFGIEETTNAKNFGDYIPRPTSPTKTSDGWRIGEGGRISPVR